MFCLSQEVHRRACDLTICKSRSDETKHLKIGASLWGLQQHVLERWCLPASLVDCRLAMSSERIYYFSTHGTSLGGRFWFAFCRGFPSKMAMSWNVHVVYVVVVVARRRSTSNLRAVNEPYFFKPWNGLPRFDALASFVCQDWLIDRLKFDPNHPATAASSWKGLSSRRRRRRRRRRRTKRQQNQDQQTHWWFNR